MSSGAIGAAFDELDGLGLVALVKGREISPRELVFAGLARIAGTDARLHATTDLIAEDEIEAALARSGDGPFEGVPFLVKQLMADCAGAPTTLGSAFFAREPVAAADSAAVRRMRAAGLVIVGRTKTSELGIAPTTEPRFGGPVLNPWGEGLSPGGSSGGAGALVAARALPLAHATDGGGSIRIPAALCGLFGLKPSRGRVSLAPLGETLAGAGAQLCVSVSVRDSAVLLDALAGSEPGDPYAAPPPRGAFRDAAERDPPQLRVGFLRRAPGLPPLEPSLIRAVEDGARLLEALGHAVEEVEPPYDARAVEEALFTVMAANVAANIVARAGGRPFGERDFEPVTFAYAEAGRRLAATDYIRAVQAFHRFGRKLGAFFGRYDILLSPTLARVSLPLGAVRTDGGLPEFREAVLPMIAFTAVCNAAGVPAASVPLCWSNAGLPIGLQLMGRHGGEETLLSLAGQLERARPWRGRRPP